MNEGTRRSFLACVLGIGSMSAGCLDINTDTQSTTSPQSPVESLSLTEACKTPPTPRSAVIDLRYENSSNEEIEFDTVVKFEPEGGDSRETIFTDTRRIPGGGEYEDVERQFLDGVGTYFVTVSAKDRSETEKFEIRSPDDEDRFLLLVSWSGTDSLSIVLDVNDAGEDCAE